MFDRDAWLEIFNTVLSNPLRTGLTGLSIALGIFILVVMQGLGSGLESGVQETFGDNAANVMEVRTGNAQLAFRGRKPNRRVELHNPDEQALKNELDTMPSWSRLVYRWGSTVQYGNQQGSYNVRGVDPDQSEIGLVKLTAGRFVSPYDLAQERKVAVIGAQLVQDLYPKGTDPAAVVGTFIQLRGIQFAVIGAFDQSGSRWENRSVYVPFSTAQSLFQNDDVVSRVSIGTGDAEIEETRETSVSMLGWLKDRLVVHPDDAEGVWVENRNEEAEIFRQIFQGIRLFVWFVGLMTLLAGAMGVANIMAIVVRERTKEIGIRKALGATGSRIVGQIIQEAVFLMLISGCVGLLAGIWLLQGIAPFVEHDFFSNPKVNFETAMLALFILVTVGVISAVGPAVRAVSIRPVEALRDE
ncbi:MAG: ABC transporter permease [Bacteroidetes bacterium]|nr:ABC transporter permease [Bacteroidota bacterium]MDA1336621.1 ABC transporter permease [Bacteroidota bacterium]